MNCSNSNAVDRSNSNAEDYEVQFVHKVYEAVAEEFSDTRYRVWPTVKEFLDQILPDQSILEVGCGNGKNLIYLDTVKDKVGCDICEKFVEMNQKAGIECVVANGLDLPFPDNKFDYTLSVAVVHHFSTESRRLQAINELVRVTKPGGQIFIEVWALEQPGGTKRSFTEQDTLVPWKDHDTPRYYHVFKEGELEELVQQCDNVNIVKSTYDNGNWIAVLHKKTM